MISHRNSIKLLKIVIIYSPILLSYELFYFGWFYFSTLLNKVLWREMNRWSTEDFYRAVKWPCVVLKWWLHVIKHLSKPIEWASRRVNAKVNSALWMIRLCQCRFISCNKGTSWWGMLMRETACVRAEVVQESLNLPQFCWNLKLL